MFFSLEYFDCVPFLSLHVFIDGEDEEEGKEDPGSSQKVPDIVTVVEIQEDALSVHFPEISVKIYLSDYSL